MARTSARDKNKPIREDRINKSCYRFRQQGVVEASLIIKRTDSFITARSFNMKRPTGNPRVKIYFLYSIFTAFALESTLMRTLKVIVPSFNGQTRENDGTICWFGSELFRHLGAKHGKKMEQFAGLDPRCSVIKWKSWRNDGTMCHFRTVLFRHLMVKHGKMTEQCATLELYCSVI